MTPYIKGMLARHSGCSSFDNPYPWGHTWYGSNAQKWKRGYYKAGRTPYRQLIPTIKIGVPVVAILWLIAEMVSFGLSSPEVDTSSKACLAEEVTPYYEPFGLVHPDFPEWMILDKGGMPVEAEDAFIPEYEPEHVEEFFDEECVAVIDSPGTIPLVLIGSLYFVGRLV